MEGLYNLTGSFHPRRDGYRASSEEGDTFFQESSGENGYRFSKEFSKEFSNVSQQCCQRHCHQRLEIRDTKSNPCQQLQPLNPNTVSRNLSQALLSDPPVSMERTPSGHSIISNPSIPISPKDAYTLSDTLAANEMIHGFHRFRQRNRHSVPERILTHLLLTSHSRPLDNEALQNVLHATDKLFFNSHLSSRVQWEWSHPDSPRYNTELIGTTALRKAQGREGYETLIVLSRPMLWSGKYSNRLLLSTFLHELVHCYLFIRCGFKAMENGGHTRGFRRIARVIDRWAGGLLHLRNVRADLRAFSLEDYSEDSSDMTPTLRIQPQFPDLARGFPGLGQRLPRIDRARYMRVAQMSRNREALDMGGSGSSTPRQGWSGFVAFAETDSE